ncbi:MAG: hypothetical protein AB1560_02305 [Pseudomonadota bacterium]
MKKSYFIASASAVLLFLAHASAQAASIAALTIDGYIDSGIVGSYPVNATYSWISNLFPANTVPHSWTQAPGTDGGILIGQAQPNTGEITAPRPMYNQDSWLYSVGNGVTVNSVDGALNFQDMRMYWGGTILDLGNAPGTNPIIPLVADINALSGTENGWQWLSDNSYQLLYHSVGSCSECQLTIHLYGSVVPVPIPAAAWLFGFGLMGLLGLARRRKNLQAI